MNYSIGEMAQKLGISTSTLRYYDKEGLLPFVKRSEGGIRIFKEEDFRWLHLIDCLKKTGLSIKEIKTYIDLSLTGDSTISERLQIMQKHRENVVDHIHQLQRMLYLIDYKCWYYETAQKAGTCKIHENIQEDNIPEEFRKGMRIAHGTD